MSENEIKTNESREVETCENNYHPFWSLFNSYLDDFNSTEVLKTDIQDEGEDYRLEVEVPGIDKKDIQISLEKGYLTIKAKTSRTENHHRYLRTERYSGTFSRSFYVGERVSREDINASVDNGILTLLVSKPKKVEDKEKFIEIK